MTYKKNTCQQCKANPRPGQGTCHNCHAVYARVWRKTHPLIGEARYRSNARSYAHVYLKRGKLIKKPCQVCGSPYSQMHHEDYDKPLEVTWLCRTHHLQHHKK